VVQALAGADEPELLWRNELGGLTFRLGSRFVKWNPTRTGINLVRERVRLEWIATRHPAPIVVDWGTDHDAQWLVTEAASRRVGRR
jgi:kanamycin kinase